MIQTIAVIGAGTMGSGIAQVFSRSGYQVHLYDAFSEVLLVARDRIRTELRFLVEEDYISEQTATDAFAGITFVEDFQEAVSDADYVIEATPENIDLKKRIFKDLDLYCKDSAILSTNTSSLELKKITEELPLARRKHTLVAHWYNPPHLIPIIELSSFGELDPEVFEEVYAFYQKCGKKPIRILKDIPGMIANRLLHAQAREAFYLYEIGAASLEDIDNAFKYGPSFRNAVAGMFEVADMGGLEVWLAGHDNILPSLCNSDQASDVLRDLVMEGKYGYKTGQGFFEYPPQDKEQISRSWNKRLLNQLKSVETDESR